MADPVDDMCPNCLTPWKCNGPHLDPQDFRPPDISHDADRATHVRRGTENF